MLYFECKKYRVYNKQKRLPKNNAKKKRDFFFNIFIRKASDFKWELAKSMVYCKAINIIKLKYKENI